MPSASRPADLPTVDALLRRQVHFVLGKGGVGKSSVSCALALHLAQAGKRVLLTQVNAQDSHQRLLGLQTPVPHELTNLGGGLVVVNIDPHSAMREYALMTLKFESLYKAAFENRLTQAFLKFVPSLSELTQLGKIWFHAEETEGNRRKYDHIIVDLPSTGHGLGLLRVARVVREVSRKGPMAEKTREMEETFRDPDRACLHVVTLPEELPANETLELLDEARREAVVPLGMCIVNQINHPIFDAFQADEVARLESEPLKPPLPSLIDVASRRLVREELERRTLERLNTKTLGTPRVLLPYLATETFGRAEVDRLKTLIARATMRPRTGNVEGSRHGGPA